MVDKLTVEQIRRVWTERAVEYGQSTAASWGDSMAIELEIQEIVKQLQDGDLVLDVGCANGYSTVQYASQRRIHIRGIDYIPEMIKEARSRLSGLTGELLGEVDFDVGDLMTLNEPMGKYNKVVATRVIANLGEWDHQIKALRECASVLRRGGRLLLSDATLQGWIRMNDFRREWGLPDIPMPAFNNYLDEDRVAKELSPTLKLLEIINFSSTYYVGTRVLKPLLIKSLELAIDVANTNTNWNRWFSQLPPWGDYGTQKLFVFQKA